MKTCSKIIGVLLLLVSVICLSTACKTDSGASVQSVQMPQTVFVKGQEIDWSRGSLTVLEKGESREIPLSDPSVSVTGYAKDQLGEQELTVHYQDLSATLSIRVVERLEVKDYETSYLAGDDFNPKGTLVVTNDDGTSYEVSLGAAAVTIEGYDPTASAGELKLTVRYQDYVGSFTVQIRDYDSVTFTKPTKNAYKSHEETIDLNGGFLTLKGGSGVGTKYIELDESMISGFDLSAATPENRNKPLNQTITVTYGKNVFHYQISITYSDVSWVKQSASEFSSLNWSADALPEISAEQGEKAVELVDALLLMSSKDKSLITTEEQTAIVRVAAVYGYLQWSAEFQNYESVFADVDGKLTLLDADYETVKSGYDRMKDSDASIYVLGDLLTMLASDFSDTVLTEGLTVGSYLEKVYASNDFSELQSGMKLMLDLYDQVAEIPSGWTADDLPAYSSRLSRAMILIAGSDLDVQEAAVLYEQVSSWRADNDLFELLYTHCYLTNNTSSANVLKNFYLPERLEAMYSDMIQALYQLVVVNDARNADASDPSSGDNTLFRLFYRNVLRDAEKIASEGDAMELWLYDVIRIDLFESPVSFDVLISYLRSADGGYLYYNFRLLESEDGIRLWDMYLDAVERYRQTNDPLTCGIDEVFRIFVELAPSEQYAFLMSLSSRYESGVPEYLLNVQQQPIGTYFVYLTAMYYNSKLPSNGFYVFENLLISMEAYSRYCYDPESLAVFQQRMNQAKSMYALLGLGSGAEKTQFDSFVGFLYEKYDAIYQTYGNDGTQTKTDLGEWADDFEALAEALRDTISVSNIPVYSVYFATYEKAQALANRILQDAPDDILWAYYYEAYPVVDGITGSLDALLCSCHEIYMAYMTRLSMNGYLLWDLYSETGLRPFMAEAAFAMMHYLNTDFEVGAQFSDADAERFLAILAAFRELDPFDQHLFLGIDAEYNVYYSAMLQFFQAVLPESASGVAEKLPELEKAYVYVACLPDNAEALAEFLKQMQETETLYNALSEEDRSSFDRYLSDMYSYYLEKYAELTKNSEQAA